VGFGIGSVELMGPINITDRVEENISLKEKDDVTKAVEVTRERRHIGQFISSTAT